MAVEWGYWKFKGDAQTCYDEVQTLGESYTAEDVLELAKNEGTELHKCFTWDDTKAAELYRLMEARSLISSFTVKIEVSKTEAKSFRVVQHDPVERSYKPVTFTVRNDEEYKRLLAQAKVEMTNFKNRYRSIVELEGVIEEIDKALTE